MKMLPFYRIATIAASLLLTLTSFTQLNGTYTIDQSGAGDYVDFTSAVADLTALGVSGPVVLEVLPGTYTEQISIGVITGVSAVNTVSFVGQSLDSTDVILNHPSSGSSVANYTISLAGGDHLDFSFMTVQRSGSATFGTVVLAGSTSNDWLFSNCEILSSTASGNSDCIDFNGSNTDLGNSGVLNSILANGGINMTSASSAGSFTIEGNTITSFGAAISLSGFSAAFLCRRNSILVTGSNVYCLNFGSGSPVDVEITGNTMITRGYNSEVIRFANINGTSTNPILVANNFLIGTGTSNSKIALWFVGNVGYVDIFSNSIVCTGATGNHWGINGQTTVSNVRVHNNAILAKTYPISFGPGTVTSADHNVMYSQTSTASINPGANGNSLYSDPMFIDNANDLHLQLGSPCHGAGSTFGSIVDDIDDELRPQPVATDPDIGADEDSWICIPMSGTYAIGPSAGAAYPDFSSAVAALSVCGIAGPVVFEVEDGTYSEQIQIPAITGSSSTNTVTFQGQSLDSMAVALVTPTTGLAYALELAGCEFVNFSHMSIVNTGTLASNRAVEVSNGTNDFAFRNCRFDVGNTTEPEGLRIISSAIGNSSVTNSFFENGSVDIVNVSTGSLDILQNEIFSTYRCINMSGFDGDFAIEENTMSCSSNPVNNFPINLSGCDPINCSIERNWIKATGVSPICLRLANFEPVGTNRLSVTNNTFIADATSGLTSRGIWTVGTVGHVDIFHNSISTDQSNSNSRAIFAQSGAFDLRIHNNALRAHVHPLYAPVGSITSSDHNVFYSVIGSGVDIGPTYTNIPALFAGTGMNGNSVFADPMYVDNAHDLHLQNGSPCHGAGSTFGSVMDDIDNDPRPLPVATNPDVGSDEDSWVCIPMAGTYVIGSSAGADFADFSSAVSAMHCGITGPVIFEVEDGTYIDQVSMPNITGTSATNTITFRGQSLDSSLVTLEFSSIANTNGNHILKLSGIDYVSFEHLTIRRTANGSYGRLLYIESNITVEPTFSHCRFLGRGTNYNDQAILVDHDALEGQMIVSNCRFQDIRVSMDCVGVGSDESYLFAENIISNCGSGFDFHHVGQGITIVDNVVDLDASGSFGGITLYGRTGGTLIERNWINGGGDNCIVLNQTEYGSSTPISIRNNFLLTTGSASGLSVSFGQAIQHLNIDHNSVSVANGRAVNITSNIASGSNVTFRNNIIKGSGYGLYNTYGQFNFSDADNNLFDISYAYIARWPGTYTTLAQLQAGSGQHANSKVGNADFVDPLNDLHIGANSAALSSGQLIAPVYNDIDGESRPQPVASTIDIGADESPLQCLQANGVYVIGTSGAADFPTFNDAVNRLLLCGIDGPVVFEVEDGTFNEQLVLPSIPGVSSVNTITFRGQSLDSSLVTLSHGGSFSSTSNHTLLLDGIDNVSFEHIRFRRTGGGYSTRYSRVIEYGNSDPSMHTSFANCWIQGDFYSSYATNYSELVRSANGLNEALATFTNCRFQDGGLWLYWNGASQNEELIITGCEFVDAYNGVYASSFSGDLQVVDCDFSDPVSNSGTVLELSAVNGGFLIDGNRIDASTRFGIELVQCANSTTYPGVVRNNSIINYSTSLSNAGVYMWSSTSNIHLLNNSISEFRGRGVYDVSSGSGHRFVNNAVRVNYASSYCFLKGSGSSYVECSNNILFNAGAGNPRLASWNGVHFDIPALQSASGLFANSVEVEPLFVDPYADLHIQSGSPCAGVGFALGNVIQDFDGESRPNPVASSIDIGCDETPDYCQDLNGAYVIGSSGAADFSDFTSAVDQMVRCGITGSVVFNVEAGTYNEQFSIPAIPGNDATNTITFQGVPGDSSACVIRFPTSTNSAQNHVVLLEGADHVTFSEISMERYGPSSFSYTRTVVRFAGSDPSVNAVFDACDISAPSTTAGTGLRLVWETTAADIESLHFKGCRIAGGWTGIHIDADSHPQELKVDSCHFEDTFQAVELFDIDNAPYMIRGNNIENMFSNAGTSVFRLYRLDGVGEISGNRVVGQPSVLFLSEISQNSSSICKVFNNEFVSQGGEGIRVLGGSQDIELTNNSISAFLYPLHIQSSIPSSSGLELRNNIFHSLNTPNCLIDVNGSISICDNNLYHRGLGGTNVAINGNSYSTIAALNAATGFETNGFFAYDGLYVPNGDLRSYAVHANNNASVVGYVSTDITGNPRDASSPDIGAYEFIPELWEEQLDVCHSFDQLISTGLGLDQYMYADRKVIGKINDNGNNLGIINGEIYINSGAVRVNAQGQYYMDRNWQVEPQNQPDTVAIGKVDMRLFYSAPEFADLAAIDPLVSVTGDVGVSQYDGPNENCEIADNTAVGNYFQHFPVPTGTQSEISPLTQVGYIDLSVGNFSEFYVTVQGSPLPVELIHFNAQRIDENTVGLEWITASESDNQGFEIHRRRSSDLDFTVVGWVNGNGNSSSISTYEFVDNNRTKEVSYYFLKQIDYNGASEVLPTVAVEGSRFSNSIQAYPNPANESFSVSGDMTGVSSIVLHDASGRGIRSYSLREKVFALNGISPGVYRLVVERSNGEIQAIPIIKR